MGEGDQKVKKKTKLEWDSGVIVWILNPKSWEGALTSIISPILLTVVFPWFGTLEDKTLITTNKRSSFFKS